MENRPAHINAEEARKLAKQFKQQIKEKKEKEFLENPFYVSLMDMIYEECKKGGHYIEFVVPVSSKIHGKRIELIYKNNVDQVLEFLSKEYCYTVRYDKSGATKDNPVVTCRVYWN